MDDKTKDRQKDNKPEDNQNGSNVGRFNELDKKNLALYISLASVSVLNCFSYYFYIHLSIESFYYSTFLSIVITLVTTLAVGFTVFNLDLSKFKSKSLKVIIITFFAVYSLVLSSAYVFNIFEGDLNVQLDTYKQEKINYQYELALKVSPTIKEIDQRIIHLNLEIDSKQRFILNLSQKSIDEISIDEILEVETSGAKISEALKKLESKKLESKNLENIPLYYYRSGRISTISGEEAEQQITYFVNEINTLRNLKESTVIALRNDIENKLSNYKFSIGDYYIVMQQIINSNPTNKNIFFIIWILFMLLNISPFIIRQIIFGEITKPTKDDFIEVDEMLKSSVHIGGVTHNFIKSKVTEKDIKIDSFKTYFNSMIESFEREVERSNSKASLLLSKGLKFSTFGVLLYISSIIIFQVVFSFNDLKNHHIIGMVSCTLVFIFFQFIGAWFFKQYKYFVDTSTYFMKLKTNIERYLLILLAIEEFDGNADDKKELFNKLIDFLSKEISYPESYLTKNADVNLAKETFETVTGTLNKTIKALKDK